MDEDDDCISDLKTDGNDMIRLYVLSCMIVAIFTLAITKATAQDRNCDDFLTQGFFASASPEVVATCLEQGRAVDERDDQRNSPLHLAVAYAPDARVTWVLLRAGSDPSLKNLAKHTPMHMAAAYAIDPLQVVTLAFWGAEVDRGREGDDCKWPMTKCTTTPLHLAARRPEAVDVVTALIKAGAATDIFAGIDLADIDEDLEEDKSLLPLHLAARHANVEMVGTLLRAGAKVDAKDKGRKKRTALHYAAARKAGALDIVQALLDAGASADATDFENTTPLMLAASHSTDSEVVAVLLDAAEKPCMENKAKSTASLMMYEYNPALHDDDVFTRLHDRCSE